MFDLEKMPLSSNRAEDLRAESAEEYKDRQLLEGPGMQNVFKPTPEPMARYVDDPDDFSWPQYIGYCVGVILVALVIAFVWGIL